MIIVSIAIDSDIVNIRVYSYYYIIRAYYMEHNILGMFICGQRFVVPTYCLHSDESNTNGRGDVLSLKNMKLVRHTTQCMFTELPELEWGRYVAQPSDHVSYIFTL